MARIRGRAHNIHRRRANELLAGALLLHPVDNARLGDDDELRGGAALAVSDHFFCRADRVGQGPDLSQALGVNDDLGFGKGFSQRAGPFRVAQPQRF